ncbi:ParA family protein [Azohydromonas lata]|uniref:ParA family protein n=1 Tax=Azohydromonas lata TaxID=45677 RepID=UPI000AE87BA1|nr:AAA family ATPase [Azohydromonas lata]
MENTQRVAAEEITLPSILEQAERVKDVVAYARETMLAPTQRKKPPVFSTAKLMELTGLEKPQVDYRLRRGELPSGKLTPSGARREFSLAEARVWARETRRNELRPAGATALTIAIGNFKGGVSKTTTAATLAQGLSMLGHSVLLIDCDPQGSLTTLMGILPDSEVELDDTVMPLFSGKQLDITYAVRSTYWDGIDLVAAAPVLFGAEFALPARQTQEPGFEFWSVLDYGLDAVREKYDFIIIDTPPALSYTTINALMAANGIIMPLPPNPLDFASSAQFWDLFGDLTNQLITQRGGTKTFAFVDVLPTKVESADQTSLLVKKWMASAYGDKLVSVEIPKTAAANASSAEFGTVYDQVESGSARTFKRATDAYDRLVELIEDQAQMFWNKQVGQAGGV